MKYRPNTAAILQNAALEILICERRDANGSWQFPQGGLDEGETHEQALERELEEELGLQPRDYRVITHKGPYRYLLGEGRTKKGFDGQEQRYFLLSFIGADGRLNVETVRPEFQSYKWIKPADFKLKWLPFFKHEVYRAVFKDFFDVRL